MKINLMGINYSHNGSFRIDRPTGSGDYLILLIRSSAVFMLKGKEVIAEPNSIILFDKGTPQKYYANSNRYTDDFIHFEAEGEGELHFLPFDTLLPLPSVKQVSRIFRDIYLEYISNNANREISINLLLKYLFVKINDLAIRQPLKDHISGYYDELLNLRSMIYQRPREKWTIDRLSRQVGLSPSHFQRLYKNTFGVTCIADVITSKIEYAKASLAGTGLTVREIAALCGYENEEHFMRQFKQSTGMTPSQYRKKIMN